MGGFEIKSTVEKVVDILTTIRDGLDMEEAKYMSDLNFCIKMILQNKLYDADLNAEEDDNESRKQVAGWMEQSKQPLSPANPK